MPSPISRRDFNRSTVLAAPALLNAQTAGTKVNLGWVGLGNRGGRHIKTMMKVAKDGASIGAICDTFAPRMAQGKDVVATQQGAAPETYHDYYKMLENDAIDAVVIMTPEHLHRDMAIAALEAGKHVYCEKPLSHTIEEGHEILAAVKRSGKKFQVGTQRRSSLLYQKAKEIYESGVLGEVVYAALSGSVTARRRSRLGATRSPRKPAPTTPITKGSWAARRIQTSTSNAISNGVFTGTTRAASRPTCWSTRPTRST